MGCCNESVKNSDLIETKKNLYQYFQAGRTQKVIYELTKLRKQFPSSAFDINSLTFTCKFNSEMEISALGLSLVLGKLNLFRYCYEHLKADPIQMESQFLEHQLSGLYIICAKNYPEMFRYYSKLYFEILTKVEKIPFRRLTEDSQSSHSVVYTSVQNACLLGNLEVVKEVAEYCKIINEEYEELSFVYRHEITGENCALLACKGGNYKLIRFLHSNNLSNFHITNTFKENALQVLCAAARQSYLPDFPKIFIYLCEIVQINFFYNYQETLLLIDLIQISEYFQKLLSKHKILIKKPELESESLPIPFKQLPKPDSSEIIDFLPNLSESNSFFSAHSHASIPSLQN